MKQKMLWSVVGYTAVIGAGLLTRHAAREAYRKTAGSSPPENPGRRAGSGRRHLAAQGHRHGRGQGLAGQTARDQHLQLGQRRLRG